MSCRRYGCCRFVLRCKRIQPCGRAVPGCLRDGKQPLACFIYYWRCRRIFRQFLHFHRSVKVHPFQELVEGYLNHLPTSVQHIPQPIVSLLRVFSSAMSTAVEPQSSLSLGRLVKKDLKMNDITRKKG